MILLLITKFRVWNGRRCSDFLDLCMNRCVALDGVESANNLYLSDIIIWAIAESKQTEISLYLLSFSRPFKPTTHFKYNKSQYLTAKQNLFLFIKFKLFLKKTIAMFISRILNTRLGLFNLHIPFINSKKSE